MKKIEKFQMVKIFAISNNLGISEPGNKEDDLHLLVGGITGKDSIKELTYGEASMVILRLEQMQGNNAPPKRKSAKKYDTVPGGITEGQQKKIWALMYELKKWDKEAGNAPIGDRICGIIKKELHVDSMVKNPFVWLDFASGNKLIEILKKYVANAKKQGV